MRGEKDLSQAMVDAHDKEPPNDAAIIHAVRAGGRTMNITRRLGLSRDMRPAILRVLRRLERAGKVKRHDRYTAPSSIYWLPAEGGDP